MKNAVIFIEHVLILLIAIFAIFVTYNLYLSINKEIKIEANIRNSIKEFNRLCENLITFSLLSENSSTTDKIEVFSSNLLCISNFVSLVTDKPCSSTEKKYYSSIQIGNDTLYFEVLSENYVNISGNIYPSNSFIEISNFLIYIYDFDPENNKINAIIFSKKDNTYVGCFRNKVSYICPIKLKNCTIYCKGDCKFIISKEEGKISIRQIQ